MKKYTKLTDGEILFKKHFASMNDTFAPSRTCPLVNWMAQSLRSL